PGRLFRPSPRRPGAPATGLVRSHARYLEPTSGPPHSQATYVHEAASRKDAEAHRHNRAHVKFRHQLRNERNDYELRQSRPSHSGANLLRVVPMHLAQILRQDVDRTVQRKSEQEIRRGAKSEVAAEQKPKLHKRLPSAEFDP